MESQETISNSVRKITSVGGITLDKISKSDFQKEGTLTAQIRQIVTTKSYYPSKKADSNLQANIFDTKDFGFTEQEFISEEARVAFLLVPLTATKEDIEKRLVAAVSKGACIYRVLSNAPILSDDQKYAIGQALKTVDDFANSQVARYPENAETIADGTAGKIILDKAGNVQYRRSFFWNTAMADVDVRGNDKYPAYQSAEIKAELAGASVMQGQTIL